MEEWIISQCVVFYLLYSTVQYCSAESWMNAFLLASVAIAERKGKENVRTRVKVKFHRYSTVPSVDEA